MSQTRVRSRSQITLPKEVINQLNLSEGDVLNIHVRNGKLILEPQLIPDAEEEWMAVPNIRESLERGIKDVMEGRTHGPFSNSKDLVRSLKKK